MYSVLTAACAAQQHPTAVEPHTQSLVSQAEHAQRQRRYDRARALYQRAQSEATAPFSRAYASREYGLALIFWGEYRDAEQALSSAVDARNDDVASWHDLGMVRHRLGRLPQAETAFRTAKRLAPRDPRPRIALAAMLAQQRQYRHALAEYRQLLGLQLPGRLRAKTEWMIGQLRRMLRPQQP